VPISGEPGWCGQLRLTQFQKASVDLVVDLACERLRNGSVDVGVGTIGADLERRSTALSVPLGFRCALQLFAKARVFRFSLHEPTVEALSGLASQGAHAGPCPLVAAVATAHPPLGRNET